jgi:hypothetical protein
MIVRIWQGVALEHNADLFRRHFADTVLPLFQEAKGFLGFTMLERKERDRIEFVIISRWDTMDAIRAVAGIMPDKSVLMAEGRAFLEEADDYVSHYIVAMEEPRWHRPTYPT